MKKVFVIGREFDYEHMFMQYGFAIVSQPEDADLICFTGGADVHPSEYGHELHHTTYTAKNRDAREVAIYNEFPDIPAVGICRGAQLLNVLNGGLLFQDVDNHGLSDTHKATDYDGNVIDVSSTHHQMMIPDEEGEILLTAKLSTRREAWDGKGFSDIRPDLPDVECVYYKETMTFCFQPHPEYFNKGHVCTDWFFNEIKKRFFP